MEKSIRVWCLLRVASALQSDAEAAIARQRESCREFADRQGWEVVGESCEVGVSGNTALVNRDKLITIVENAERRKFDVLLVSNVTRMSRNAVDFISIVDALAQRGVCVWSVSEGQLSRV